MEKREIKIEFVGPGVAIHDLLCWLCNKESAVYNMHPNWVFEPCWKCQKELGGTIYRIRSRFIKWLINF